MKFNAKRYTEEHSEGFWIFKNKYTVYVGEYEIKLDENEWKIIKHLIESERFDQLKNDSNFLRYQADGFYFLAPLIDYRGSTGNVVPSTEGNVRQYGYWIWDLSPLTFIKVKADSSASRARWEEMFINNYRKIKALAEKKYEIDNRPKNESIEV